MDGMSMSKQLIHELTAMHQGQDADGRQYGSDRWLNTIQRNQHTWSPRHNYHQRDHRPTVQELEALYLSLAVNPSENQFHYSQHHAPHSIMKYCVSSVPPEHFVTNPFYVVSFQTSSFLSSLRQTMVTTQIHIDD